MILMRLIRTPISVSKSTLPPFEEYTKEIERIWSSSWLTNNGPIHKEFEEKLIHYLNTKHVSLLVNGHMALETAIKTLGLKGEIITTPFTFASTAHAISNSGLTPVFCDINSYDFNIDVTKIESLITEQTSAIIPVHVFGNPCNVLEINRIAKKHGLKVIYDAAHAYGVNVNGIDIGNYGDISMFSLHANKVFHSIEGGVLTYNHDSYKGIIDKYRNFGISGPETVEMIGTNAKMNEFQAAMGIVNLRYIDAEIEIRKEITFRYRERLGEIKGINFLQDLEGIRHNYGYFPILVEAEKFGTTRNELHEELKKFNVLTRKYFYPLCSDFDCYKQPGYPTRLENAEIMAEKVLALPMYSTLTFEMVDYVCDAIYQILKSKILHYGKLPTAIIAGILSLFELFGSPIMGIGVV
jgi:dTDP-4-amino-4,6-dideoxygalactose transaminase